MSSFLLGSYSFLLSEELTPEEIRTNIISAFIVCAIVASLFFVFPSILRKFIYHVLMGVPSFDENYSFNQKNLRFAYKIAGCHIVVADVGAKKDQYLFLISYLKRKFPNTGQIDLSTLPRLHKNYEDVDMVFKWLGMHLDKDQKLTFLDFLIDLAFYNGKLSSREMKLIYSAGDNLDMTRKEIRSMLSVRHKFYEEKAQRERKQRYQRSQTKTTHRSKKKEALKILEINDQSVSIDQVKKAYRNMAKKHHPDRFHNASASAQEKANERFAMINEAYEYLEKLLS